MQDTYASEKSAVGDFDAIGYEPPTSTVFTYSYASGFKAVTKTDLDGCGGNWVVVSTFTNGKTVHEPDMPDCAEKLTPNFKRIGTSN